MDFLVKFASAFMGVFQLGGEVAVPTPEGEARLKIPAGTPNGKVFRLRGKGIQRLNYSGRGDQYVKIVVEVPKNLSKKQKDILTKVATHTPY